MPLELHFDADQEHQTEAVEAVCAVFDGQRRTPAELAVADGDFAMIPNRRKLAAQAASRKAIISSSVMFFQSTAYPSKWLEFFTPPTCLLRSGVRMPEATTSGLP